MNDNNGGPDEDAILSAENEGMDEAIGHAQASHAVNILGEQVLQVRGDCGYRGQQRGFLRMRIALTGAFPARRPVLGQHHTHLIGR